MFRIIKWLMLIGIVGFGGQMLLFSNFPSSKAEEKEGRTAHQTEAYIKAVRLAIAQELNGSKADSAAVERVIFNSVQTSVVAGQRQVQLTLATFTGTAIRTGVAVSFW